MSHTTGTSALESDLEAEKRENASRKATLDSMAQGAQTTQSAQVREDPLVVIKSFFHLVPFLL